MNTRSTLLLLLVAAALFGGITLYESNNPSNWKQAAMEGYVLDFDRQEIDGIEIESNGEKIKLRKRETGWELAAPVKDRADSAIIDEILTQCKTLRKEATLPEKDLDKKALKNFGVAKSALRLRLQGKNAPPELLFGKETAVEKKIYLRLDNAKTVYVVSEELKNLIARKADEFRDRTISNLEGPHVHRIILKTAAGEMELQKQSSQWRLTKPLQSRASNASAVDLIGSILQTPIIAFAPDQGANLNAYGLAEPRAMVTLWAVSQEEPFTLEIGAQDEKTGQTYARISNRNSVCLLPDRVQRLLTLKPNDLRDRHLLRVELDIVDRITIQPTAQPKTVLQRHQEDWLLLPDKQGARPSDGKPANTREVEAMVAALQSREVTHFVSDIAADLAPYGLDEPRLKITFSSYATDTTAEGTAGEQAIVSLAFGKIEGDLVYARAENEPFVVALDKSILDLIPTASTAWLSVIPFRFDPKSVTSLDLIRDGKRVTLTSENGTWSAPELQSLVNTLSTLTPMRRQPEPLAEGEKEAKEQIIVAVRGRDEPLTISLGTPTADGARPIAVAGEPGTFLISAPDASALSHPLPQ